MYWDGVQASQKIMRMQRCERKREIDQLLHIRHTSFREKFSYRPWLVTIYLFHHDNEVSHVQIQETRKVENEMKLFALQWIAQGSKRT